MAELLMSLPAFIKNVPIADVIITDKFPYQVEFCHFGFHMK